MLGELFMNYGRIRLLDIECDAIDDLDGLVVRDDQETTHVRATVRCLPGGIDNILAMQNLGFQFVDRQVDVSINLLRSKLDFRPLIRVKPRLTSGRREEVRVLARRGFPGDRRFYLSVIPNGETAAEVISAWVDGLDEYYVVEHMGAVVGFLAFEEREGMRSFVHMAAVDERFRSSGAVISLYATAAKECQERGFVALDDRISTMNPALINMYSLLGASFSNPTDVFLKEMWYV
ncbi:MAG: GNAT family N-acetyltransferase [Synergistaceae bacterium]|jgi:hypothetical protein|nr:GNAT family N-acetyltransferase [Synergistaceae bacterium]